MNAVDHSPNYSPHNNGYNKHFIVEAGIYIFIIHIFVISNPGRLNQPNYITKAIQ